MSFPFLLTDNQRYRTDSNRRVRFCRPPPSHSATVPFWLGSAKLQLSFYFKGVMTKKVDFYHVFVFSFVTNHILSSWLLNSLAIE